MPETLGELLPLLSLLPFVPLGGSPLPLSFLLEGRIPLRQFSGRAQADNMGGLAGLAVVVQIDPDCGKIVEVSAQTETRAGPLEGLRIG